MGLAKGSVDKILPLLLHPCGFCCYDSKDAWLPGKKRLLDEAQETAIWWTDWWENQTPTASISHHCQVLAFLLAPVLYKVPCHGWYLIVSFCPLPKISLLNHHFRRSENQSIRCSLVLRGCRVTNARPKVSSSWFLILNPMVLQGTRSYEEQFFYYLLNQLTWITDDAATLCGNERRTVKSYLEIFLGEDLGGDFLKEGVGLDRLGKHGRPEKTRAGVFREG